jgi:hypothetical protein
VLNLLCGLNPQYRYVKPVITSKSPLHTLQNTHSFLILEELSFQHDSNAEASQALTASHGDHSGSSSNTNLASSSTKDRSSASPTPCSTNNRSGNGGGNNRSNNRFERRHDRGGGGGSSRPNANASNTQSTPWAAGYNPWQGMVQA